MRVAGYGRVSTVEQALKGTSAEEQRSVIEKKCIELGHKLYNFYSDDGFSGKTKDRPGLQKLLSDAKEGKFDLIMFTKLDRLGRNLRDVKNIFHQIKELSLEFYCVEQPEVNKAGLYGDLFVNILSSFSEFESEMIRQRTTSGRMVRWKNNDSVMGSLPFGYTREDNGKIMIHDENRKVYEKIVSLYVDQNYCMRDIAIKLKEEGISSPGNSPTWHNTTISDILKNQAYTGETCHNKYVFESRQSKSGKQYFTPTRKEKPSDEWIRVKYPPLISKDRFSKIQSIIASKKRRSKKHHIDSKGKFMAENVLFCGYCGARIKKTKTPKENFHYCCYWWETSQRDLMLKGRKRCTLNYINADKVDGEIFGEVVQILVNPSKFAASWYNDEGIEELKRKVERLKKRDYELKSKLKEGYKLITGASKASIKKMYLEMHGKDEAEYDENLTNLKNAEVELNFAQNKIDRLKAFEKAFTRRDRRSIIEKHFTTTGQFADFLYKLPFDEKKRLLEAVVSVENGGKCLVRHVTPSDIGEDIDNIPPKELHKPLLDRAPLVDCIFNVDLNKIEAIISGLNKKDLFSSARSR